MPLDAMHANQVLTATTLTTTAETQAASVVAGTVDPNTEGVQVSGSVNVTTGTGTTAVTVRVRYNSATGTQVGNAMTHTVGAAVSASIPFDVLDSSLVAPESVTYVVTVAQVGATANGTVNAASIIATAAAVNN